MRYLLLLLLATPVWAQKAEKPKPAAGLPTESGTYDLTVRVVDETKTTADGDKWSTTKDVVLKDVTVDMSKHCRWFTYQGKETKFEDDDLVVISWVKK